MTPATTLLSDTVKKVKSMFESETDDIVYVDLNIWLTSTDSALGAGSLWHIHHVPLQFAPVPSCQALMVLDNMIQYPGKLSSV